MENYQLLIILGANLLTLVVYVVAVWILIKKGNKWRKK